MTRALSIAAVLGSCATALAAQSGAPLGFDAPRDFSGLEYSKWMDALVDLDLDGDLDVVALGGDDLEIWRNDGDGDLVPEPEISMPALYEAGNSALVGDVTEDGTPDLVLGYFEEGAWGLMVIPGAAGGSLGAPLFASTPGGSPTAIALGDSDGDGDLEIAVVHNAGSPKREARWFDWDGSQLVSGPALLTSPYQSITRELAALDLDGDGDDDLVAGTWTSSDLLVLTTVAGVPTFGGTIPVDIPQDLGRYFATGDLEGDGDTDLVVYGPEDGALHLVVLEAPGGGAPLVPLPAQVLPSELAYELQIGDWDGDGDLDLANHWEGASFFENRHDELGAHDFAVARSYATSLQQEAIAMADVDLDGHLDLAMRSQVLFGDGRFEDVVPLVGYPPGVMHDWEGDGDVDGFTVDGRVHVNDGIGGFTELEAWPPIPGPSFFYQGAVAFRDFDGDGRRDWVVGLFLPGDFFEPPIFQQMRLLADDGLGGFVDVATASTKRIYGALHYPAVDLDADGDVDLIDRSTYWLNDATGSFTDVPGVWDGTPEDAGDVDGDGDIDVIVVDEALTMDELTLQRQQPGLVFTAESMDSTNPSHFVEDSLVLADLDLDGDLDAVAAGLRIYRNLGGSFSPPVLLAGGQGAEAIDVQDIDGDGLLDIVGAYRDPWFSDELVFVYRNSPSGYEPVRRWWTDQPMGNWADVDGDGDRDPVGSHWTRNRLFHGPGAGFARQYGAGTPGAGGAVPVLGARGPVRVGSTELEIRLRRAVGGAPLFFAFGLGEAALAGFPLPSLTGYVDQIVSVDAVSTAGSSGAPGAGTFDFRWTPGGAFAGTSLFAQAFVVDAFAAGLVAQSGGLELHIGL